MAATTIANLWTPEVWVNGLAERAVARSSILNTAAVVRRPEIDAIAAGGGLTGNMPFLKEPDGDDEIQAENTAASVTALASGTQVCAILNRQVAVGAEALAGAVSASDPVGFALNIMADWRLRRRVRTLAKTLRGFFHTAAAALSYDKFVEIVGSQSADTHFIKSAYVHSTLALLGEAKEGMTAGGVMFCHSVIEAALGAQDDIDYIRDSEGKIILRTYKGMPLFISDSLVRAGTTSGYVYETYFLLPGSIGMGDKPQVSAIGEVASLVQEGDASKNQMTIYDRTRFVMHPSGAKWNPASGVPAGQSPTDAELAAGGNWALAFADAKNVGIVRCRTNG